jgi:hypothetical protein
VTRVEHEEVAHESDFGGTQGADRYWTRGAQVQLQDPTTQGEPLSDWS